jgi:uncharacterized protein
MRTRNPLLIRNFTLVAVTFEISLGLLALLLGWIFGISPLASLTALDGQELIHAALLGTLVAGLLTTGVIAGDRYPLGFLHELRHCVRHDVLPLFRNTSLGGLLIISLAAGIGEELLFRGFLQAALTAWIGPPAGPWIGLLLTAALFGICHWLCAAYGLLATAIGLILGLLVWLTGNLVAPIVTHSLYDFLVLLYLLGGNSQRP